MKILLDTHIFLWYVNAAPEMPAAVLPALRDPRNTLYLSVASMWEATIKYQLGKLALPQSPDLFFPVQRQAHNVLSLGLDEASIAHLAQLPQLHRDPFDRILVCQAIEYGLVIATVDGAIRAYRVKVL